MKEVTTSRSEVACVRSTKKTPSVKCGSSRAAASTATRVLPAPPGPRSVTSWEAETSPWMRPMSGPRPTNDVRCEGSVVT